jgi:hypothetical protein
MSEARSIDRIDEDIRDIKATLARLEPMIVRIDATLPHLATKAELTTGLSEVRAELATGLSQVRAELVPLALAIADKPSRGYMWLVVGTLIVAYAAGLAVLAVLRLVIQ